MVRENRAPPPTPLSTDEINQLLFKNSTQYKNRNVDLDSVITRANVKKYLTLSKLNQKAESWLKCFSSDSYARVYLEEWDQIQRFCDYLIIENNDPEYIIKLIQRIVTISVDSMKIKNSLPKIDEIN